MSFFGMGSRGIMKKWKRTKLSLKGLFVRRAIDHSDPFHLKYKKRR